MIGTFWAVTRFDSGCARGAAVHFWSITMKIVAIIAAAIALVAATTGCNTIEGIGQDIESVGETVAEEAR
jgi:predicted small secreted protein